MGTRSCCAVPVRSSFPAGSKARRAKDAGGWGVPALVLLLLPKCPMCLAGYVAAFTGIGLSVEAATWVRYSMLAVCVLVLTVLAARILRGYFCAG